MSDAKEVEVEKVEIPMVLVRSVIEILSSGENPRIRYTGDEPGMARAALVVSRSACRDARELLVDFLDPPF